MPSKHWMLVHNNGVHQPKVIDTYYTFGEAVQALAIRSGSWWANWSEQQIGKGEYVVEPYKE